MHGTQTSRAISGVVFGSLVLLALVWVGVDAVLDALPNARLLLSSAGGLYPDGWVRGCCRRERPTSGVGAPLNLPSSLWGVAAFQLLNPKAWLLVTTAVAAVAGSSNVFVLGALMIVVTVLCLALWAFAGHSFRRVLAQPATDCNDNGRLKPALMREQAAGISGLPGGK